MSVTHTYLQWYTYPVVIVVSITQTLNHFVSCLFELYWVSCTGCIIHTYLIYFKFSSSIRITMRDLSTFSNY